MMTVDEMISVLTHYKNGGKVQCKHESESIWQTIIDCEPRWDFAEFAYRAKPEPLVIYAELDVYGLIVHCCRQKFDLPVGRAVKKFVEVTE